MNLRDLEYFVTIAQEGNFGKAAYKCCVSQPTLSAQIKKLEEELGAPLFERSTRSLELSDLGKEIYPLAISILRQSLEIQDIASAQKDPMSGTLNLGAFHTLGPWFFPRIAATAKATLPSMELYFHEFKTQELISKLHQRELDAAFLAWPDGADDFVCDALGFEPFVLLIPEQHPFATNQSLQLQDLQGQELFLLVEGHCLRDQSLDLCHRFGASTKNRFQATGLETLRQTIKLGSGMTLFPQMAKPEQAESGLLYLDFTDPKPGRTLVLAYRPTHPKIKALRALAQGLSHWFVLQGMHIQ